VGTSWPDVVGVPVQLLNTADADGDAMRKAAFRRNVRLSIREGYADEYL
jgi:hypothetical protein